MHSRTSSLIAAATAILLSGCNIGMLAPQGPVARAQRVILFNSLAIMLAIVIPTIAVALYFAWHYRQSNPHAKRRLDWAYSGRVELIVWSIPTLVVLFLGGIIWVGTLQLDPARPLDSPQPPLEIQVVSLDWKWLFIYPHEQVASVNQLVVPAGQPLHFSLTSGSVMNGFFVPQLGGMIATMPHMVTQLHLQADRPGQYQGLSTQFSGDGFSDMHFMVHAVPDEQFDRWIEQARRSASLLDAKRYSALSRQGTVAKPFTYGSIDPKLFDAIVREELPAASGPDSEPRGRAVRPPGAQ